jgi:hypothetical protein
MKFQRRKQPIAKLPSVDRKHHDRRAKVPQNAQVTLAEIDDPYEIGSKILAVRSLRDDVLATLRARDHIAEHQFAAGRAWQRLYEQAEIGGARSLDPRWLRVDGHKPTTTRDVRRLCAIKYLVCIGRKLGQHGTALLYDVLVAGLTLRDIAAGRRLDARSGSRDLIYLGRRLREALDTVAHELGLA